MKRLLVVHCKHAPYDVLVDRTTLWGNPFVIGQHGDRAAVIALFEEWLSRHPEHVARVKRELRGKVLGCWCKPYACHGDVLARIANE